VFISAGGKTRTSRTPSFPAGPARKEEVDDRSAESRSESNARRENVESSLLRQMGTWLIFNGSSD
jgi:hypothetical protein